ncbi:hypothetical protein GYA93_12500 [Gordonia desulfuricans]|uniref:Virulence-associated protein E-like domain-containing protein n=1 Tax=Gordonia desulfuricans TaxID=89051 RepID=A0A7K3LQP0_9ACTN|nr:VapE domain-containing protein [Gordonia desulfuricans]NDK90391.1 hypothetical protein [Gordonia desulfuricans]
MAFNPAKITVKRARAEAVYNPDAVTAAGLRVSGAEIKPTVQAVAKLLDALYPRDDLFYDTDLGHIQFGDLVGLEATTALIRELEIITGKAGWYEKKSMVYDVIESTRRRSPHAAMLLSVPKDLPVADLTPWTSRFADPAFTDEAIRLMVHGYVQRGLEPGAKFDYAGVLVGPQGTGKTTLWERLVRGREIAYDADDRRPMETSATCERIVLEEASSELFKHERFNTFKDRVTMTNRGEDAKYIRGKAQLKARAVLVGTSNDVFLLHPALEGTRRFLMLVMDRSDASLMPFLTDEVWEQLVSEALRKIDEEAVPVLSPEGEERQRAALASVTRPDDDLDVLRFVLDERVRAVGYFQKSDLREEVADIDPDLARGPAFGRAWRKVQHEYQQVSMRVGTPSRVTKVFIPASAPTATAVAP